MSLWRLVICQCPPLLSQAGQRHLPIFCAFCGVICATHGSALSRVLLVLDSAPAVLVHVQALLMLTLLGAASEKFYDLHCFCALKWSAPKEALGCIGDKQIF